MDCTGLLLVKSGQLRAYILSDEGREITLYRLFDRDICLFSASCMIRSIQFEIVIEAEKDTELRVIPAHIYQGITEESAPAANFTNVDFPQPLGPTMLVTAPAGMTAESPSMKGTPGL